MHKIRLLDPPGADILRVAESNSPHATHNNHGVVTERVKLGFKLVYRIPSLSFKKMVMYIN